MALKVVLLLTVLCIQHMECVSRWNVFSTNTLLQWTNKSIDHASNSIDRNINIGVSTTACNAIHLNMVVRDAARYPSLQKMNEIRKLQKKIVQSKDPEKFPELDKWKLLYDTKLAGDLSSKGIEEIAEFGSRIGKDFKRLFEGFSHDGRSMTFVSSSAQRSIKSLQYFQQGLWSELSEIPKNQNTVNDSTMSFSRDCYNHEKQRDKSELLDQFYKFSKTTKFMKIIESLKEKLSMHVELTAADVYLINEWCAYGTSISNDMTWCHLLTDEDRDVLEYGQDLLNYYKFSYGNQINGNMACPLVKDIFNTLDSSINRTWNYFRKTDWRESSYIGAKFQFGDADTIIPLLTALGLYNDTEPLLSTNMDAMRDRKFKTSQISSFASSVAFIVYACDNSRRLALNEFHPGQQTIRIHAFVNEQRVPFCEHRYYCLYDGVRKTFTDFIDNCNITDVCGIQPNLPLSKKSKNGSLGTSLHFSYKYWPKFCIFAIPLFFLWF